MKTLFSLLLACTFILVAKAVNAQDAHVSQFYANPVYLNPSLAGMSGLYRAGAGFRSQGKGEQHAITSLLILDAPLGANSGWGLHFSNDIRMAGILNTTSFGTSLAHRVDLSPTSKLAMGLQVGLYQKELDWSGLVFEDQLDERDGIVGGTDERFGRDKVVKADVTVGMAYSSEVLFGGIKISHINRPTENFAMESTSELPIKTTLHGGAILPVGNQYRNPAIVSPNVIYEKQGTFEYLHLGFYYGNEVWTAGMWYRLNDAVIASLGMNLSENFRVGYSYDMAVNDYNVGNNAHEVSVNYQFDLPKNFKVKNRYKGKCPNFQKYLF